MNDASATGGSFTRHAAMPAWPLSLCSFWLVVLFVLPLKVKSSVDRAEHSVKIKNDRHQDSCWKLTEIKVPQGRISHAYVWGSNEMQSATEHQEKGHTVETCDLKELTLTPGE